LAPLELVLWLPILMFVTALMVNVGTSQAWRERGEIAARDAAWRTRWPRQGASEPRPNTNTWPATAGYSVAATADIQALHDQAIQQPVAYGTLNPIVVRPTLHYDTGMLAGSASISRPFPMLPKLGSFDSGTISHPLLDEQWQTAQMHWQDDKGNQTGLPANTYRRIKALYSLPEQDPNLANAFSNALQTLFNTADNNALQVLDRDEEINHYTSGYADFHPRIYRRCEIDPEIVRELEVERIIDEVLPDGRIQKGDISCLPQRMTRTFLGVFRSEVQKLKAQIDAIQKLGGTGGQGSVAGLQSQIDALQVKIDQLEAYQKKLPGGC
jgi:hypothetical protein